MLDGYIICATPRSGSTLLCDLLASTKVAGNPDSYFMSDMDPRWAAQLGLPLRGTMSDADHSAAYLAAAVKAGRGGTPMFGLRLMRANLDDLCAMIDRRFPQLPSDKARLERAFGNVLYIHLAREDKLAQAVSLVKAEQTGLWHVAPDGAEIERLAPPKDPEYDFGRIARALARLEQQDAAWVAWFDRQGIQPLRIGYERLSADPAAALTQVCTALGVPAPDPGTVRPGVAKLSDATSAAWMRRYRLEAAAG
jgi:LPS sulfotransferase NodH